jgi:hypothetical protein
MLPQNEVGPNMARTMVEDRHGVKPLGALVQALWRDTASSVGPLVSERASTLKRSPRINHTARRRFG